MSWLLRDSDVLAAIQPRQRGWTRSLEGALVLRGPALVHTLNSPASLDLAWCSAVPVTDGHERFEVRRISSVGPHRLARPHFGPGPLVIASEGAFDRWHLRVGDRLEIREA